MSMCLSSILLCSIRLVSNLFRVIDAAALRDTSQLRVATRHPRGGCRARAKFLVQRGVARRGRNRVLYNVCSYAEDAIVAPLFRLCRIVLCDAMQRHDWVSGIRSSLVCVPS